ncbi:MAG: DUF1501 domain-containing protein [Phycisphaera sp.]|nr:DUF1501 domain-containing protein [Phycisphaera sp.]
MFRIEAGATGRYCDGLSRRTFVQAGVAGLASVGLADVLRAAEAGGGPNGRAAKKDTRVILVWLDGGPSHLDLWDMKPDAAAEYRGIWSPIKTNVPGIDITEMFPKQAKVADKFSIVRSIAHNDGDHFGGAHRMLTSRGGANGGNTSIKYPGISAISSAVLGSRRPGLPAYTAVPYASSVGLRPGYFGAHYLGPAYNPFETNGDPNSPNFKVQNLNLPGGMSVQRLEDRRTLLRHMDSLQRAADTTGVMDTLDRFEQSAWEMVTGPAAQAAFDIAAEDNATRELYGRNTFGQSCLLARRLAEAGCTFVTVHSGGWDHHWNLQEGMERMLPPLDQALAALFTDLAQRGLTDKIMVMVCGEFSRTPKMNDGSGNGTPGRDHWGNSMSVVMAGGGLRNGVIVGSTDAKGEEPRDNPLTVGDMHATIYHVLGVDPHTQFLDHAGRPVPAIDYGEPIRDLL